jgi:hypothetical protein
MDALIRHVGQYLGVVLAHHARSRVRGVAARVIRLPPAWTLCEMNIGAISCISSPAHRSNKASALSLPVSGTTTFIARLASTQTSVDFIASSAPHGVLSICPTESLVSGRSARIVRAFVNHSRNGECCSSCANRSINSRRSCGVSASTSLIILLSASVEIDVSTLPTIYRH